MKITPYKKTRLGLILLAYLAFIALGLPDGLLGVGWPSIRASFNLPLDSLGILLFAVMAGYLTSSFFSGRLIARMGVGGVLAVSCALTGAGLIGYTLAPYWGIMVALGVIAGLGAGAVDSGMNTYVAANFNEGLMQWLHASYGIGVTLGPLIMTLGLNTLGSWHPGYFTVGAFQLALAVCFTFTLPMWKASTKPADAQEPRRLTDYKTPLLETLRQPSVWLSLFLFFLYTGCEVTLGTWAYTLLTESRHIQPAIAGIWAGSYWAMFTIGRILAGLYTRKIGVNTVVQASLAAALTGAVLLWWNPVEWISLAGIALIGFAIAPIFPGLVSGTSGRVSPRYAANTIGMQMASASLGATAIPSLVGVLARNISIEVIPVCLFSLFALLLVCFLAAVRRSVQAEKAPTRKSTLPVEDDR